MKKTSKPQQFSDFKFSPAILTAIKQAGYKKPTEVQSTAIPPIMQGRDVLAGAETGSGKTAAFALPLLDKLIYQKREEGEFAAKGNQVRALILVPTRELAIQINDEITAYAKNITPKIRTLSVFGGVKINPQMMALRGGADVLIATPGRLLDLYSQNAIKFNKLQTLVLDEVDRLVGEGFKDEIEEVFKLLPNKRQNLMFTATYPDSIRYLIRRLLKQPVIININPSNDFLIDQRVFTVNREKKTALLAYLLNEFDWKQILVFCSAKKTCDNLVRKLENQGITAVAMHGNKEQRARAKALREFKQGKTRVLIATDVAARGIDIEQLPCVINYELPRSPKDYIHRIGRTGRAGESGFAISLIAHHEYAHFSVIEKHCDIYPSLEREQMEGFEADATAPPPIQRTTAKKKVKKKLSKKKRLRLQEKKEKAKAAEKLAPQKVWTEKEEEGTFKPKTKPASTQKKIVAGSAPRGIRKGQVASISQESKSNSYKNKPEKKSKTGSSSAYKKQGSKPWSKSKSGSSSYKKQDTKPWSAKEAKPTTEKRKEASTSIKKTKKSTPSDNKKKSESTSQSVKPKNASIWGEVLKNKK